MIALWDRFTLWVDSHGEDAGAYMIAGMVVGPLVIGVLLLLGGLVVLGPSSPVPMVGLGMILFDAALLAVMG